jgi:hypothetical protein
MGQVLLPLVGVVPFGNEVREEHGGGFVLDGCVFVCVCGYPKDGCYSGKMS